MAKDFDAEAWIESVCAAMREKADAEDRQAQEAAAREPQECRGCSVETTYGTYCRHCAADY